LRKVLQIAAKSDYFGAPPPKPVVFVLGRERADCLRDFESRLQGFGDGKFVM
jgi:hypothetical protein